MKFIFTIFTFFILQTTFAQSPTSQALGVRFGGSDGTSAEISFQSFVGGNNRLELDLGFIEAGWLEGFKFSLLYHWVGNISDGFYWYIGAGGSVGSWSIDDNKPGKDEFHDEGFFLDADGQLGIEYYFTIPLQISLDMRPEFGLINDDFDFGYGLGLRYCFH